ncbi:MAG: hypothetical protein IJH90_08165 [Mogibacterium sp.]|nr:hypothetical protein [Mogibacterium sp.]
MTVQMADYVTYNGRKFTLIDIEMGKSMIGELPGPGPLEERWVCTACWRGYTADYFIIDDCLYVIRSKGGAYDEDRDPADKTISPEMKRLHYTGSCIIAGDDAEEYRISDFLECYLNYEEALELHFTNGVLDEVRNLKDAVKEFREGAEAREYLARRDLKYEYDDRTYRWQER